MRRAFNLIAEALKVDKQKVSISVPSFFIVAQTKSLTVEKKSDFCKPLIVILFLFSVKRARKVQASAELPVGCLKRIHNHPCCFLSILVALFSTFFCKVLKKIYKQKLGKCFFLSKIVYWTIDFHVIPSGVP